MRISLPSLVFDEEILRYCYIEIAWKDADFPTLLDFLDDKFLRYCYVDIAWKDADFPALLDFWRGLSYPLLLLWREKKEEEKKDADFPTLLDFSKDNEMKFPPSWCSVEKKDADFPTLLLLTELRCLRNWKNMGEMLVNENFFCRGSTLCLQRYTTL